MSTATFEEKSKEVPSFVIGHAPLLHLYTTDPYRPSSASTTLQNTRPQIAVEYIVIPSPPLTLANLNQLNSAGANNGEDVYLTSFDDVSKNPGWLKGGSVKGADGNMGAIVVVEKEGGVTDVFYFYFFAFNWGGVVLEKQLGDHVGDWEHNMIRFVDGMPKYVWFSQHANGEAYTFEALQKDGEGKRPIVYCANGSHALYATSGTHDHTIPNLNLPFRFLLVDEADKGPIHDPVQNSKIYAYDLTSSTFTPYDRNAPTGFLDFRGRWGDAEYPKDDPRQDDLLGNRKYVGGPTGPWDKQLGRKQVWPENDFSKGQFVRTKLRLGVLEKVKGWLGKITRKMMGKRKTKRVLVSGKVVQ